MHSKGNYSRNKKITYGLGKNICKWWDSQGVTFQNIQAAHADSILENKPIKKMGRGPKQTLLQRRYTDGQQTHEEMLNITTY